MLYAKIALVIVCIIYIINRIKHLPYCMVQEIAVDVTKPVRKYEQLTSAERNIWKAGSANMLDSAGVSVAAIEQDNFVSVIGTNVRNKLSDEKQVSYVLPAVLIIGFKEGKGQTTRTPFGLIRLVPKNAKHSERRLKFQEAVQIILHG